MYSQLATFKQYIDVTGNDKDTLLQLYLDSAGETINRICGVTSFSKQQFEERVEPKINGVCEIFLNNKPVDTIDKINGETVSMVKGEDYIVVNDRKVVFKNLQITDGFLNSFLVTYTAGYTTIPSSLQFAEMNIAGGMYAQTKNLGGVQSYKLGDEQITFASVGEISADMIFSKTKSIIDKYKNFSIAKENVIL